MASFATLYKNGRSFMKPYFH